MRDVERLAQLQDDSVEADKLAATIGHQVDFFRAWEGMSTVPVLAELVDAKVRWVLCCIGRRACDCQRVPTRRWMLLLRNT